MTLRVGLIGTGHMGAPIARRLREASLLRVVYDVDASKAEAAVGANLVARDPDALLDEVDVVITLLPTGDAIEDLFLSRPSLLDRWSSGQVLVDMGTTDPEMSRELERNVHASGGQYLEAPVSGGTSAALDGTLTIVTAGEETAFSVVRPILEVLGTEVFFVGPAGAAQTLKLANNLLLAVQTVAVGEAWALVRSASLDLRLAHRVLSVCSGDSRVLRTRVPEPGLVPGTPPSEDYAPGFPVRLMMKDIQLAKRVAATSESETPMLLAAEQRYAAAILDGFTERDISIVSREVGEDLD